MAPPADIAELQRALERCCADLAAQLKQAEAAAEAAAAESDAASGIEPVEGGPMWRPLILASIPGLDTLVSIIKPPLQVIVALLQVIAALLDALAAILIGLPDILRALIMAAYALLRDIINDLLNTGAYMYLDVPGITPRESSIRETGLFIEPAKDWKAGRDNGPPPVTPDGWTRWANRFAASFDDPGDLQRPVVTEGAPIQAIFIVAAAPSLDAIAQFLYLLGKLLNIDKFKLAFEKYDPPHPDPRRMRARKVNSTPPDWRAVRLRDIFPALEGLLMIPEALKGLLSAVDNLSALIKNLAAAMHDKANLLLQMAAAIQAIIDLLDALKSTGFYSLGVATQGGVTGLKNAFMTASNRPPGGYIGGVCFMASGPNLAKAAMLFDLLGGTTAIELAEGKISLGEAAQQGALGKATALLESSWDGTKDARDKFAATTKAEAEAFADAIKQAVTHPDVLGAIGQPFDDIANAADNMRVAAVEAYDQAGIFVPGDQQIRDGIAHTRQAQRYGARSLALGYGSKEPDNLLRDDDPPPDDGTAPPRDPATGGKL
ncbi:MAG TPA: hypothetical protein VLM79_08155 [Kofleriaceae bacterium]|nr:hypothetical protein [Kofleriaceae bacterium]